MSVTMNPPNYRLAHEIGAGIGYKALGINSALINRDNVLDVVQLQSMGYQAAEQGLDEVVRMARRLGHTWEQIGLRFGLTRQGAQQRFGPRMGDSLGGIDP